MRSAIPKKIRIKVWEKYGCHCGYCGKPIEYKAMQVDHIEPVCNAPANTIFENGALIDKTNDIENLMPSCRRCNHYKRDSNLELFRRKMKTLHERLENLYTHKVALDYGIVIIKPFEELFFFEKYKERSQMKYTKSDGQAVVSFLQDHGFINIKLIGSLARDGESNHDIDIYVPNPTPYERDMLKQLFKVEPQQTDWGGLYFAGTHFGDVDIFFDISKFDY